LYLSLKNLSASMNDTFPSSITSDSNNNNHSKQQQAGGPISMMTMNRNRNDNKRPPSSSPPSSANARREQIQQQQQRFLTGGGGGGQGVVATAGGHQHHHQQLHPQHHGQQEQQQQQQQQQQHNIIINTGNGVGYAHELQHHPDQLRGGGQMVIPASYYLMHHHHQQQQQQQQQQQLLGYDHFGLQVIGHHTGHHPTGGIIYLAPGVSAAAAYAAMPVASTAGVVPATTYAIDADTGRPVRIINTQQAPAYAAAAAADVPIMYRPPTLVDQNGYLARAGLAQYSTAATPAGAAGSGGGGHVGFGGDLLRRQIAIPPSALQLAGTAPTTTGAAGSAVGVAQYVLDSQGNALPLYITNPLGPTTDLGCRTASPPLVRDGYSFSGGTNDISTDPAADLQDTMARKEEKEQKKRRRELIRHEQAPLTSPPLDLPVARPGQFPAVLYSPADEDKLTNYQCLLRKQLELFEADVDDVRCSTRQGRTAPIR
jgi:hypothetical protein